MVPHRARASAAEFPDVTVAYNHVDAATIYLVTDPGRYDVIVTDNLFGDIITDLAAAIAGGIGLAASGNLDVSHTNPSMFEPVHGSAPDIAGQGKADPTAAVLSVSMLLEHVGEPEAAARVEAAVAADLAGRDPKQPGQHRARSASAWPRPPPADRRRPRLDLPRCYDGRFGDAWEVEVGACMARCGRLGPCTI